MNLADHLELQVLDATEIAARVRIRLHPVAGAKLAGAILRGAINGPRCRYARTLPAKFNLAPVGSAGHVAAEALIPDPSFWTSELPFRYDAQLEVQLATGERISSAHAFGLRRFEIHGANLRLERRRTVLRGVACGECDADILPAAREAELALIVPDPSPAFLEAADELGVTIVGDFRDSGALPGIASWRPSLLLVINPPGPELRNSVAPGDAYPSEVTSVGLAQGGIATGQRILAHDASPASLSPQAQFVAVELDRGERPPAWLGSAAKPIIAIRRGETYADLVEARLACDRLQAELAPEFTLAGYFVASS